MEKLTKALRERVAKATGPDREIDLALGRLEFQFEADEEGRPYVRYASPGAWEPLPAYTATIDAALALVERKLPKHFVTLRTKTGGQFHHCTIEGEDADEWQADNHPTAPLAILAALLAALESQP